MTNQIKYKWASLGTGVIANELAQALEALGGKFYSEWLIHLSVIR